MLLEELACQFGLRTQDAIDRLQALQEMERITGICIDWLLSLWSVNLFSMHYDKARVPGQAFNFCNILAWENIWHILNPTTGFSAKWSLGNECRSSRLNFIAGRVKRQKFLLLIVIGVKLCHHHPHHCHHHCTCTWNVFRQVVVLTNAEDK